MRTNRRHYRVKLEDVLTAHKLALLKGGSDGIRDLGAIEAAIARPYMGYYRAIESKAAALTHSLAFNHGFVDGNKRTTVYTLLLLLDRSGYAIAAPSRQVLDGLLDEMIIAVVEHRIDFDALVVWFKARIVRTGG